MPAVAESGYTRRRSGILTPATTSLGKRERVMARKKFLRLIAHMEFSRAAGLVTRFMCDHCYEPVKIQRGATGLLETDAKAIDVKRDPFSLTCSCTIWTIR